MAKRPEFQIQLRLGAMAPSIRDQLKAQGFESKNFDRWQEHSIAISRLLIHGLLTETEARKARDRLFKQISKELGQ